MNAARREPQVREIARSIRKASLGELRRLAQSENQDQRSRDANEWYWVCRFGHPLYDHINIHGFMSVETKYAKDLSEEQISCLTPDDLIVLALSESSMARSIAAGDESTPASYLERLAGDSKRRVRKAVGHNPKTPPEIIARMLSGVQSKDDVDYWRGKLLWSELDSIPVDHEVALDVAHGYGDFDGRGDALRLALARREYLPLKIRIALAASHVLSPELANVLASDSHQDVRVALAGNWVTPVDVLVRLAADDSPAVRIAAGSNSHLPAIAVVGLLKDKDRDVRREVTVNGYLSDEALLALDDDAESRRNLHERLRSHRWAWDWAEAEEPEPRSARLLRELAQSPHPLTRAAVAANPGTPVATLELLAQDEDAAVRQATYAVLGWDTANAYYEDGYKRTPIWWYRRELDTGGLAYLARSQNSQIRAAIAARLAQDASDPEENSERISLLHDLVRDSEANVRAAAARNAWIDFGDILMLADDIDEQVRRSAVLAIGDFLQKWQQPRESYEDRVRNWLEDEDSIPSAIPRRGLKIGRYQSGDNWFFQGDNWFFQRDIACDRLARVNNSAVRALVASYPGTYRDASEDSWLRSVELSEETLLLLLQDRATDVRAAALANTGTVAAKVAARLDVSVDVLVGYSRSIAAEVRNAVAANASTPAPVLANLARDRDGSVRAAVAANQSTPQPALLILTGDPNEDVLLSLLTNPNTPREFLEQQASRLPDYGERGRHRRLAANPGTPTETLRKIAYSEWPDVRELVAKNRKTPPDTLEILSFDEERRVRDAAARP